MIKSNNKILTNKFNIKDLDVGNMILKIIIFNIYDWLKLS
jgi:hypothetical protein